MRAGPAAPARPVSRRGRLIQVGPRSRAVFINVFLLALIRLVRAYGSAEPGAARTPDDAGRLR